MLELDNTKYSAVQTLVNDAIAAEETSVDIVITDLFTYMSAEIDISTMITSEGDIACYNSDCLTLLQQINLLVNFQYILDYYHCIYN